jgi:hypothetical protein
MRSALLSGVAAIPFAIASCSGPSGFAVGDTNALVVIAADSVWEAVSAEVGRALRPTIFTVRDESTFRVEHFSPTHSSLGDATRFRQVVPIGKATDFWVEPALDDNGGTERPAIVEAGEVWARNQSVTAVVLPESGDPVAALRSVLPELGSLLDARFRDYALSRMFASGQDTVLRDSLARLHGFSLLVPDVYTHSDQGSTQVFRNHASMGGTLMRVIAVTWREGEPEPTQELALAWRDSVGTYAYDMGQVIQRDRFETKPLNEPPGALEVQGSWEGNDPGWIAAGPFIDRIVPCPAQNRTYFLDAWLYAPGKAKYEYMIQLNTILDTFRCGGATAGGGQ